MTPSRASPANPAARFRKPGSFKETEATITTYTVVHYTLRASTLKIARRGEPHGSGLGKTRWVVERTISWLHNFRRLRIGFERLAFIHEAFMKIACCIICWRRRLCQVGRCSLSFVA
ncbi:transposase [Paraburkholderia sp. LEh10]|nr:transposase [Paraburkholderia sp. LEh10]MBP0596169.1 transposase [Paraburkholderia sp. LEh10]